MATGETVGKIGAHMPIVGVEGGFSEDAPLEDRGIGEGSFNRTGAKMAAGDGRLLAFNGGPVGVDIYLIKSPFRLVMDDEYHP